MIWCCCHEANSQNHPNLGNGGSASRRLADTWGQRQFLVNAPHRIPVSHEMSARAAEPGGTVTRVSGQRGQPFAVTTTRT